MGRCEILAPREESPEIGKRVTATPPEDARMALLAAVRAARAALPTGGTVWSSCLIVVPADASYASLLRLSTRCSQFGDEVFRIAFKRLRGKWNVAYWKLPKSDKIYDSSVTSTRKTPRKKARR